MKAKNLMVLTSKEWAKMWGKTSRLKAITSWAESVANAVSDAGLAVEIELNFERESECVYTLITSNDDYGLYTSWWTYISGMTDLEAVILLSHMTESHLYCIENLRPESRKKIRTKRKRGLQLKSDNEKTLMSIRENILNAQPGDTLEVGQISEAPGLGPAMYEMYITNNYPDRWDNWEAVGKALLNGQGVTAYAWRLKEQE